MRIELPPSSRKAEGVSLKGRNAGLGHGEVRPDFGDRVVRVQVILVGCTPIRQSPEY